MDFHFESFPKFFPAMFLISLVGVNCEAGNETRAKFWCVWSESKLKRGTKRAVLLIPQIWEK